MTIERTVFRSAVAIAFLTACPLDPKTVGQETHDGDGSGSGDDGSASADDDGASDAADDGASADDDGATSHGDGASDAADDGGVWDDCEGRVCGSYCHVCDPEDPECAEPGTNTVCLPDGTCEPWPSFDDNPCPGVGVEPGVEELLTQWGGCADMTVYATDAEVHVALHVVVSGLVAEAEDTGAPVVREYAADDPELSIELTYGSGLLAETCSDFFEEPPTIAERWRPAQAEGGGAGTVMIEVQPGSELDEPRATVTFTGVNLRRMDFDGLDPDLLIDELVISDVFVGWVPG
ncbi:MAG TPA: hypothetical protein VFG69_14985 [Nannocystaceae bacterium]|nr:hypothetical protein [Nannocystaceae bacterium]